MTNANEKKTYIAHTYIFRNGALRHSEKEFGTAVAAFNYLYKKIKRYASTTDVTHTVEAPNGKELYRNRLGYDVRFADSEIEKLYDEYEGITDTAEAEENYLNDYAVSVEAFDIAVEGEIENAKAAEVEESFDYVYEVKYIGRRNYKYAIHYHLTDEEGYGESGRFFCDNLKVAFRKCAEYGKNILGKAGYAFIKADDAVIYVRYGHGGECVRDEEVANIIRELIKERDAKTVAGYNFDTELDTEIDDAIFAEVEKINAEVKSIAECAAVSEGGDLAIEGKVVSMPDKKGKLRYYKYSWDNLRDFAFDTTLMPISKEAAQEIAKEWSIEHGYITFDDFMAASNAEYKKIRSLYIKAGGWLLRQYDIDLANELTTAENPEYVLKEFRDWQKSLKQFITTKNFHFAETAKEEVVKYRKKLLKMKNAA